jgi:hypothetical protein
VVEKPVAKLLAWVGWTYSHSQKRHVLGFHIVLLPWCTGSLRLLSFEYLTFDLRYNARWFTKWLDQQKIIWVSTLKANRRITYRSRTQPVAVRAKQLPRHRIAGHTWAWVGTVYLPQYGSVRRAVAGISKPVSATPSSW